MLEDKLEGPLSILTILCMPRRIIIIQVVVAYNSFIMKIYEATHAFSSE